VIARTIRAATQGRYLVAAPSSTAPAPLLVGFHGYAETAMAQFARMRAIRGSGEWLLVSIQALHPFYRGRSQDVVFGWMTKDDRDQAIADNVAYTTAVVDAVAGEHALSGGLVFAGFSQGVAMAFRAAVASPRPVSGVMVCGGDVPPELDAASLARIPSVLIGRGLRDDWYTPEKAAADLQRLRAAHVRARMVEFDRGHEWPAPFIDAAAAFLDEHR
jgi:predicted esterase